MESATATLDANRYGGWDDGVGAPGPVTVESPYEHRVKLVSDVLTRNSLTSASEATRLAIQVLHALDHVPEKVR
jgi:hypothetical protein